MEFISEEIFGKYSKMKFLGLNIFEKGQILTPFVGLFSRKIRVSYKVSKGDFRDF